MNTKELTARKLAKADQAAADSRLTHLAFRLLWLLLSASDRMSGIVRGRTQADLAKVLNCTTRAVQINRDLLVACGYIEPIRKTGRGHVLAYDVSKNANLRSPLKGEPTFVSKSGKANGGDAKGEPAFQKGEPPFGHSPLVSLDVPAPVGGPRRAEDALGPLGAELRRRIEPAAFEAWFVKGKARLVSRTDDTVTLAVSSKFFAVQIMNRYECHILASAPGVTRLVVEVSKACDPAGAQTSTTST